MKSSTDQRRGPLTPRAEIVAKVEAKKKMIAFVIEQGSEPTAAKIAAAFGISTTNVNTYLRELERAGEIHRKPGVWFERKAGMPPSVWAAGPARGYVSEDERMDPIITLRQRFTSTWKRGQAQRDSLVAALFGAAQQ